MPQTPTSEPPSHWNLLVIALVCAFCTIFLILSFHRLVHHHCCAFRSTTLSRNQVRRLHEDDNPSLQFHSQGLDSYIARSLPIVQYRWFIWIWYRLCSLFGWVWRRGLDKTSYKLLSFLPCIHVWFQTHSSSPLCRAHIFDIECAYTLQPILTREDFSEEQPSPVRQNHSLNLERDH